MIAKISFYESGSTSTSIEEFTKGIDKIVCFGDVCVNINLQTSADYEFDPRVQYILYPSYIFGSSDIFSIPGFPVVNKYGDIQSNSPTPWSSTDYSNVLISNSIAGVSPSIDGCTTSVVQSPIHTTRASLPSFVSSTYYQQVDDNNFSGVRAYKANTTSVLYTISTTSNSTVIRTVVSNMFTIQGPISFTGCCDCLTGAEFCFNAVMSDISGNGFVESDDISFESPIFRNGNNCLTFHTNKCDLLNHEIVFTSTSMNLHYDYDIHLSEVDIPTFSSIQYTTIDNPNSLRYSSDVSIDILDFLENAVGFKGNDVSTIFSSLFYGLLLLCVIIIIAFCFMQCCLRVIKQKYT